MKHFRVTFLVLVMFMVTAKVFAEEKNIEVNKAHWHQDLRSVSYVPTITHDDNLFHIYSDMDMENLHIVIKDVAGTILYSSIVTISSVQPYSFTVVDMSEGEFVIELTHGYKYLYGYFDISL